MMGEHSPGGRYLSLLLDQLADERVRKGSLEQRGIAIISTSGTLVAIILGFVALATQRQVDTLPRSAALLLGLALVGLVAASTAGLLINMPARLPTIDAGELVDVTQQPDWERSDAEVRRAERQLQGRLLVELRRVNRLRARVLLGGLLLEVLALLLMATTVVVVL